MLHRMAKDEKLELLRGIPLFAGLSGSAIERLGQLTEEVDLSAGRVLMRQGEPGREMFVMVRGRASVERDGTRLAELSDGDIIGEIALVDGGLRTATVTLTEDSRLLNLARHDFHTVMDEFPEVAIQVLTTLAQRVRHLDPDAVA